MKISLPLKLAIFVVLLFSAVIAACLLWTPVRIKYYVSKYRSDDAKQIVCGIRGLLSVGHKGRSELEEILHYELRNASRNRRVLLIDALLSIDKDGKDIFSKTFDGGTKEAEFLAEHWARFNEPVKSNKEGHYPLHLAAINGWKDAAALLISKGADVDAKDNTGLTTLHWAASGGHKDTAALLISKGADVDAKDNTGWTPLHRAAWVGRKEAAALLIEKGADVNMKTNNDTTPLHWAAWSGLKDTAALLIEKGADVNGMNNSGKTPLDVARGNEIKSLFRSHGAKTGEELREEQENRYEKIRVD